MFKPSKQTSLTLKALVSALLVAWLVQTVNWQAVLGYVREVKFSFVLGYGACVVIGIAVSAKKWQIIARYKGFQRTWFAFFKTYLTGTFLNNFFPGFIGGDAYRSHWLGKQRDGYSSAISTVLFDRISGLFTAVFLSIVFALLQYDSMAQSLLWTTLIATSSVVIAATFLWGILWKNMSDTLIVRIIVAFFPMKVRLFLDEVRFFFQKDIMGVSFGGSIVFNVIGVGMANWLLFQAFGVPIPLLDFLAVIFLTSVLASIPISINNIGVKEWSYYTFFPLIAVNPDVAVTVALIGRLIQMCISFFALPEFLRRKHYDDIATSP